MSSNGNGAPAITIVGGGVMGCSIAYHLAALGETDVLILEQDTLGSGATSRTQGVLRMHYSNEVTARMAWDSLAEYREFEERIGSPSGYVRTGYLLAVPSAYYAALRRNLRMQKALGIDAMELDPDSLSDVSPHLRAGPEESYAFEPQSGYADAHLVTGGYANRAYGMGVMIMPETRVQDILVVNSRVEAVVVADGVIPTGTVVVAAGPWSGPLLSGVMADVGLSTVRHQVIAVTRGEHLTHPAIGDAVLGFSGRMDAPGKSLVAMGEDPDAAGPDRYERGADQAMVATALEAIARRVDGMEGAGYVRGWSGLFTVTEDWHPVIDRVEGIDGLYCAVGFSGHGFKLAPAVGRAMAEMILGREQSIDIHRLRLSRFAEDDLVGSSYPLKVLA